MAEVRMSAMCWKSSWMPDRWRSTAVARFL